MSTPSTRTATGTSARGPRRMLLTVEMGNCSSPTWPTTHPEQLCRCSTIGTLVVRPAGSGWNIVSCRSHAQALEIALHNSLIYGFISPRDAAAAQDLIESLLKGDTGHISLPGELDRCARCSAQLSHSLLRDEGTLFAVRVWEKEGGGEEGEKEEEEVWRGLCKSEACNIWWDGLPPEEAAEKATVSSVVTWGREVITARELFPTLDGMRQSL